MFQFVMTLVGDTIREVKLDSHQFGKTVMDALGHCKPAKINTSTVAKDLVLIHQRRHRFANGGNYPYHTFNYFCRHKYYGDWQPTWNVYKYKLTASVPNMIELTNDYCWDDLRRDMGEKQHNEYCIVEAVLKAGYNGIFYDYPEAGNEYIFAKDIVAKHIELISMEINDDFVPEKEESGYYCEIVPETE